ncbi:hypothetical protein I3842_07G136000 [Carya illinoinensis]|uniref:NAD-dependent epimerase/dehydratase domain-containing protein n=1 Tax=Carya illinoinensis TaxID=32201 RepID=A0A922EMU0_CARIL|nr:hypothetical protein I3842_07G136000 [Carya illinoinensis]
MAGEKASVCVTGGGGFVASWLINLHLSKNYFVHATVRRPGDAKYAHLSAFEKASENLRLFKADLLYYDSIRSAVEGCVGVFHVASPVPSSADTVLNPEPRITDDLFVSSISAVFMDPSWPKDQVMDETCWSDTEYCRTSKIWYRLSNTEAESEVLELGKGSGLDVSTVNASSLFLIRLLKGDESVENKLRCIVDVRDVAEALILAFEKTEAEGRYICSAHMIKTDLTEVQEELRLSSEKWQRLGWNYRPLMDTVIDRVEGYRLAGLLD